MDCQNLRFSPKLAAGRLEAAEKALGLPVLRRIVVFALFVLGVERSRIAEVVGMPSGTVRSFLRRALASGLDGFVDHRCRAVPDLPSCQLVDLEPSPALRIVVAPRSDALTVNGGRLDLPEGNVVQRKVVLLSLIGEGMLSTEVVAETLGLSASQVRRLHRDLMASDVEAVLDKRRGQLKDYRVGPGVKGKMIEQFVLELAQSGRAPSSAVARRLADNCEVQISERTVRHHLSRMGLSRVRESLIAGLRDVKRGSGD